MLLYAPSTLLALSSHPIFSTNKHFRVEICSTTSSRFGQKIRLFQLDVLGILCWSVCHHEMECLPLAYKLQAHRQKQKSSVDKFVNVHRLPAWTALLPIQPHLHALPGCCVLHIRTENAISSGAFCRPAGSSSSYGPMKTRPTC